MISASNVRGDFHIHIAMQRVFRQKFLNPPTHQICQNDVLCGNMNINFYPYK